LSRAESIWILSQQLGHLPVDISRITGHCSSFIYFTEPDCLCLFD
jgi:hypothetical protein